MESIRVSEVGWDGASRASGRDAVWRHGMGVAGQSGARASGAAPISICHLMDDKSPHAVGLSASPARSRFRGGRRRETAGSLG